MIIQIHFLYDYRIISFYVLFVKNIWWVFPYI